MAKRAAAPTRPTFTDPIAWEATLPIRPSSPAWVAVIKAFYGQPCDGDLFTKLTGGLTPDPAGYDELLVVAGRRGGKSETIARLAVFEAIHVPHAIALAPGQIGLIPVISPRREQSQEILNYVRGLCALPQVKPYLVDEPTREGVVFKTGVAIKVMTADAVNVSGPTIVCAIRDEWAKWPGDDSAMPDVEIEQSLRPALAPVRGAPRRRLVGITSAYMREGIAYKTDTEWFGKVDAPMLIAHGATYDFNPNIDREWLTKERAKIGERAFAREYLCEWQDALTECWFGADVIQRSIDTGRAYTMPVRGRVYYAAIDAAFRGDAFALAIAHREERAGDAAAPLVVDAVRVWKRKKGQDVLNVEATVAESSELLRMYGVVQTFADQFGIDPLREAYARRGVLLTEVPWTAVSKASKFSMVRAGMTSGIVRLPDDRDLVKEFYSIQGRLLRSGGEQISARGDGHDDRVFAVVLVASEVMARHADREERVAPPPVIDPNTVEAQAAAWEARVRQNAPDVADFWPGRSQVLQDRIDRVRRRYQG